MTDHVVSALIAKRAELAGIIIELERQLAQHRVDLTHIDGALRLFGFSVDPESIRPKRRYRRTRYFGRNELSRLCLNVFREAADVPIPTDEIAGRVMSRKGFDAGNQALRATIHDQVGSVLKALHRRGAAESIGRGRSARWKLTTVASNP
jgi:hypothetical protein